MMPEQIAGIFIGVMIYIALAAALLAFMGHAKDLRK
jgi:hypothetical protein